MMTRDIQNRPVDASKQHHGVKGINQFISIFTITHYDIPYDINESSSNWACSKDKILWHNA